MIYKSYQDLSDTLRRNLWKIPQDVELIVGIPRSGMIAALMLAELLNKPCATLDDFLSGRTMDCGGRSELMRTGMKGRVLVIDDTVKKGRAMNEARRRTSVMRLAYSIVYACVYAEGPRAKEKVDLWLEDVHREGETMYLYEWNVLHHYPKRTQVSMWDIDGLMCKEPPSDRDEAAYEAYLRDAVPMIIPTTPIGAIVTYRLEKYRQVTEEWLARHGVEYRDLIMFDAETREERAARSFPGRYKAHLYRKSQWAELFVESSREQAMRIAELSGKPVFCYEDGRMYSECP
jgi:uncharacterized HAD superfamily protein